MVSAGQAPILIYRHAGDAFEEIAADGPPMGVIDSDPESVPRQISLDTGDLLIVLSDGVYDAKAFDGHRFGQERVEQIVRVNHHLSSIKLIDAIREELDRFMGDRKAEDDQTGIIVKRL
jgi:sigma-B regulation protein RsbU (phosphoserine phosphatase)